MAATASRSKSNSSAARDASRRIPLIDALRGLAIVLMIAYHAGYDLVHAGYLPANILFNPLLDTLQTLFAGLFIVLAGISSRFSRSNAKRGFMLLGFALLVTAVSLFGLPNPWESLCHALRMPVSVNGLDGKTALAKGLLGVPITFGILHFLSLAILLYALLDKLRLTVPFTLVFGFVCLFNGYTQWPGWLSSDYFSFPPWFFLFILGTWLGEPIREHKWPGWFYNLRIPLLPRVGRHTLLIYLAHQPILFGIVWLIKQFVTPPYA